MFSGQARLGGWGEIEEAAGVCAEAKIQELAERKMRSDKPELARAMATALENQKPFRSELPARWILAAIACEVCQAVRS
jgi:hypothetical protein